MGYRIQQRVCWSGLFDTGYKMLRHLTHHSTELGHKRFHVCCKLFLLHLITLRKNDRKQNMRSIKPAYKCQVGMLRRDLTINKYKHALQVLSSQDIFRYHILPLVTGLLRNLRIAVSRQIDQMPALHFIFIILTFYLKIIYQLCFPRLRARLRKLFLTADRIDQTWFPDITSTDKSILRYIRRRTLIITRTTHDELWGKDFSWHSDYCMVKYEKSN